MEQRHHRDKNIELRYMGRRSDEHTIFRDMIQTPCFELGAPADHPCCAGKQACSCSGVLPIDFNGIDGTPSRRQRMRRICKPVGTRQPSYLLVA